MKERFMRAPYWWIGGIVLVLAVAQLGWVFSEIHKGPRDPWATDSFGGRVTAVSAESITVADAKDAVRTYTIATSTRIVRGRDAVTVSDIAPDTFVIIADGTGPVAREIRIMKDRLDRGDRPRP